MSKHMIFIALALLLYPLSLLSASSPEFDVNIPDKNLRAVIADSLGKAPDEAITADEMATLTRLKAPNRGIRDLTGLEFATEPEISDIWVMRRSMVNTSTAMKSQTSRPCLT